MSMLCLICCSFFDWARYDKGVFVIPFSNKTVNVPQGNCGIAFHRAASLVSKYGQDSLSYLALEQNMLYFFGQTVEGLIAFVLVGKVAVCIGNPVCCEDHLLRLIREFQIHCRQNRWRICFCSVSKQLAELLVQNGFHLSKYGEEALLDLRSYEMTGKQTLKLRQKIRRAEAAGINVLEYRPQESRDGELERQMLTVSGEWLANKGSKMTFSLGDLSFDRPLDRRYFACIDASRHVQAVLTFLPFRSARGYYLDVMRRRESSIPGVMEKGIIGSAMLLKEEGAEWISLGLAPLAGIPGKTKANLLEKGMHLVYSHSQEGYGFRSLYLYKKKFAPSHWAPRYIAHERKLSSIQVGYVMVKARNGQIVWRQVFNILWKAGRHFKITSLLRRKLP